jgi:hypothetical protein
VKFHFIYHDGSELVFEASGAKHYSSHAALTDAVLVEDTGHKRLIPKGKKFFRLNIALTAPLFAMYPEGEDEIK